MSDFYCVVRLALAYLKLGDLSQSCQGMMLFKICFSSSPTYEIFLFYYIIHVGLLVVVFFAKYPILRAMISQ